MHFIRSERELTRTRGRLSPDRDGLVRGEHGITFSQAYPQIPVVDARSRFLEESHVQQARAPKDDSRARNKIPMQQLPEEIPLRALLRIKAGLRAALLVTVQRSAVNHSGLRTRHKRFDLHIYGIGEPDVIIVKKTYVWGTAGDDTNVPRAAGPQSPMEANVPNIIPALADLGRLISGSVIDNYDLNVAPGTARALDRAREMRAAVACGDDNADLWHHWNG